MTRSRRPGTASRRFLAVPALVAALVTMTACDSNRTLGGSDQPRPQTLIASSSYAAANPDVDLSSRLSTLQRTIDHLRSTTGSGWVGRQDDVTGYLGELSGGRYAAAAGADASATATAFLDEYAEDLLGVTPDQVAVPAAGRSDVAGGTVLQAPQVLGGIPVVDGGLALGVGGSVDQPRVNSLRGRIYPGLDVSTDPRLTPRQAQRIVRRLTHGTIVDAPGLVVLAQGNGALAYQVTVFAAGRSDGGIQLSDGTYFVDAVGGQVLEVRPSTADLAAPSVYSKTLSGASGRVTRRLSRMTLASLRGDGPQGDVVDVTGSAPYLGRVTAKGLRTSNGTALVDVTTPTYRSGTGEGGIVTHTVDGSSSDSSLPGPVYVQKSGTEITDADAISAQVISRVVYDYYASIGRASWDGKGATLASSVNYSDGNFCNAFFSSDLRQMVYGNPCQGSNGGSMQLVTLDVTGHEITHGVTDSTAGLNYSGQSGALNESFSDYFGNVIGDHYYQRDSSTLGEDGCKTAKGPQRLCSPTPGGGLATRNMLNGNTMDDYLAVIDVPLRWRNLVGNVTDSGGVHLNSAIWNNALWSIRTQLAKIDNQPAYQSQLAHDFDLIVYFTLTHQLGPTSTMVDAANAVEATAVQAGADATIIRVAKEIFDKDQLCAGCADLGKPVGDIVSNASAAEVQPIVSGKNIAWIRPTGGPGTPVVSSKIADNPLTYDMAWAGDSLLTEETTQRGDALVRHDPSGRSTILGGLTFDTFLAGLGSSAEGGALYADGALHFVDPSGRVTDSPRLDLGGDSVTAVATGGGVVTAGTDGGRVVMWKPGGKVTQVGTMSGPVFALGGFGTHAVAIDANQSVDAFDSKGGHVHLSDVGFPFGAAVSADYAVFPVANDSLSGGINEALGGSMVDTDLFLYSFDTNKIYNPLQERGQQGFPSISGNKLAWQDGLFGGDDIMSITLPSGL